METAQRRLLFPQRSQKNLKINRPRDAAATGHLCFRPDVVLFILVRVKTAARQRPNPDAGQMATDQFHDMLIVFVFFSG